MTAANRPLKVGLFIPFLERSMGDETPRWEGLAAFAREAEAVGFDSLWVADHFLWHNGLPGYEPEDLGAWECWSLVSSLAAGHGPMPPVVRETGAPPR